MIDEPVDHLISRNVMLRPEEMLHAPRHKQPLILPVQPPKPLPQQQPHQVRRLLLPPEQARQGEQEPVRARHVRPARRAGRLEEAERLENVGEVAVAGEEAVPRAEGRGRDVAPLEEAGEPAGLGGGGVGGESGAGELAGAGAEEGREGGR